MRHAPPLLKRTHLTLNRRTLFGSRGMCPSSLLPPRLMWRSSLALLMLEGMGPNKDRQYKGSTGGSTMSMHKRVRMSHSKGRLSGAASA